MNPREAVSMAVRSIRSHRLRSVLTVLGIVIGIASVVTFATFGASVEAEVLGDLEGSGANNVYVFASPEDDDGFDRAVQPLFTAYDVNQIRDIDGVRAVVPQGIVQVGAVTHGNETVARQQVTATVPETFSNGSTVAGRPFELGAAEAVVNEEAATGFRDNLTVGDELRLELSDGGARNVTVVGIVNGTAGELPVGGFGQQPRIYVPADPFYRTVVESPTVGVNQLAYPQVTVVADPARTETVEQSVAAYLANESDAGQLKSDDVELVTRTSGDFAEQIGDVIGQITRFVTGIAVIALVVGAIGIANIMLVSVTERTREIGIMKAVGARNRDVMQLFLFEAALLGLAGSAVGVPLGLVVGWAATRYAEVSFALAPVWMALAVAVGVLVGVVSGLYPAWRAARVDPIDALRHE